MPGKPKPEVGQAWEERSEQEQLKPAGLKITAFRGRMIIGNRTPGGDEWEMNRTALREYYRLIRNADGSPVGDGNGK